MLIKRVVIHGFKTFARRTEFLFDPGITAVVGPNGSGKSNIVDAVRWCLGEQSFSLLRSKRSADVIFSGSERKARLGMAQVSLTLDNSGGEIPIDYAEVEITRRAHRDGDNEYLVNGKRVRLSDITELLAQTGLGKRSYAVIGQGLIDKVLSLAPDERRSLFEEAAGLSGYQMKRDASLRRLEATQVNLTRVADITAELAPRLAPLKRQAERARERIALAGELRAQLAEWYGYRWFAALAQVDECTAEARILRNGLDARQAALDAQARAIEQQRARQAELRVRLGEAHRAAAALFSEAEGVGRELAVANERLRQTSARHDESSRELEPLRLEVSTLEARLHSQRAGVLEAERELAESSAAVAAVEADLARAEAERRQWLNAGEAARTRVDGARRSLTEAESRRAQAVERQAALAHTVQSLAASRSLARNEADALAADVTAAAAAHAETEAHLSLLRSQSQELEGQAALLRLELEQAESSRREADRQLDRHQTRFDLLKRLANEGAGLHSGVRAALASGLPGMLGLVAALLRPQPEHERAVETALGAALQNIVASSWEETQAVIEYLKAGRHGRATFLPLDRLHTPNAIDAPHMRGVLGNAARLVECDPRAARARDHLLNRTWFVEDLPTARRALDGLRDGPRPTIVTLGGEIVRPGGAITGGSESERRDEASLLTRERERRALPGQIESATADATAAAIQCRTLAAALAQTGTRRTQLQQHTADATRLERSRRETLDDLRRRADRAAQQVGFLQSQAGTVEQEAASLAASRTQIEATLPVLAAAVTAALAALAEHEALAWSADELLRALADRQTAQAATRGRLESRRALEKEQRAAVDSASARLHGLTTRNDNLAAELLLQAARLDDLTQRERLLAGERARLLAALAPDEATLASLEAEQAAAEADERTLLSEQRREESLWSAAHLAQQRAEDAVQQLRADVERDLSLVLPEEGSGDPAPIDRYLESLPLRDAPLENLDEIVGLRTRLGRLTNVNTAAPQEYDEALTRYTHLVTQTDDLARAAADLRKIIAELDAVMQSELGRAFAAVAAAFQHEFRKLFGGGWAELQLTDPENLSVTGIEIVARPPGKRTQNLALLSGGERSLTAMALIFAILRVSPTPFCVLDEVDAALDEANVDRFRAAIEELSAGTQFIIVTHNRRTLEASDTIYGVSMGDDGVSTVISLRLESDTPAVAAVRTDAEMKTVIP